VQFGIETSAASETSCRRPLERRAEKRPAARQVAGEAIGSSLTRERMQIGAAMGDGEHSSTRRLVTLENM
jgi:hypothetical protein